MQEKSYAVSSTITNISRQCFILSKKHKSGYLIFFLKLNDSLGLLIYTLISENQGLEKPGFSVCHLGFFMFINLAFFLGGDLEKKSRFLGSEIFLWFEAGLDFTKPWFSEIIKVQIKRPTGLDFEYWVKLRQKFLLCNPQKKQRASFEQVFWASELVNFKDFLKPSLSAH